MTQNDFIKDHIIICGVQKYDFIIDAEEQKKECKPIIIVE